VDLRKKIYHYFIQKYLNFFFQDEGIIEKDNDYEFNMIVNELKEIVSPTGLSEGEYQIIPKKSLEEGWTQDNTIHVDSILAPTEEDIDEYCVQGFLNRYYCGECGSKDIRDMNFFSHSTSIEEIRIVFEFANSVINEDNVFIDIGSRLGTILYYGYYNSIANFIGIEMNPFFIEIQKKL